MSLNKGRENLNFCLINDLNLISFDYIKEKLCSENINDVFFYSKSILYLKEGKNLENWILLTKDLSLNLYYCKKTADKYNLTLTTPFKASGLGQLVELAVLSKKNLVLGAL